MTKHNTKIEWTHIPNFKGETWNPIVGCSIASKGCTNCYAMRVASQRLESNPKTPHYAGTTQVINGNPVWTGKISPAPELTLLKPFSWRAPRSIFVNSMGDLFHEDVPDEWIDQVFAVMALCPHHIFIVLTKRAERMREYFNGPYLTGDGVYARISEKTFKYVPQEELTGQEPITESPVGPRVGPWGEPEFGYRRFLDVGPLKNVWLGVSVEDQDSADERIPYLLDTSAAVRFLSCEPLLGAIDLEPWLAWPEPSVAANVESWGCESCDFPCDCPGHKAFYICDEGPRDKTGCPEWLHYERQVLDWIIAGGESGPNARPMHPDWARSLRDQCQAADVPFFFKQWGEWMPWEFGPAPLILSQNGLTEDMHAYFPNDWDDNHNWDDGLGLDIGERNVSFERIGKARAGHLLDGQEHHNWPKCVQTKGVAA